MANVVRDPREHPNAIIPDLSKPDPLVTFSKDDIAFVYGIRWKQRYFTKIGDDYFPQPAQWDVTHGMWKRYFVPNNADWWAPLYPPDNFKRPTGPLCDGCHSVNYNICDQSRQRMECRLRKVPRGGQRACGTTNARHHPQSRTLRLCSRERHLHPMSLAGASADQSN